MFHRSGGTSDGLHRWCKPCCVDYDRERHAGRKTVWPLRLKLPEGRFRTAVIAWAAERGIPLSLGTTSLPPKVRVRIYPWMCGRGHMIMSAADEKTGTTECRACRNLRNAEYYAQKKAERTASGC